MRWLWLLILFILAAPAYGAAQHEFEDLCGQCHLGETAAGSPAELAETINQVCLACHQIQQQYSHPELVEPSFEPPKDFPLSTSGKIICVTCHTICQQPETGNPQMLRGKKSAGEFCANCHEPSRLPRKLRHYGIGGIAHLKSTPADDATCYDCLDQMSLRCLGCHLDGQIAPKISFITESEIGHGNYRRHPIGKTFPGPYEQYDWLQNILELPEYIFLPEGKVSCISCHNIYSDNPALLVINNQQSRLCLSCHIR